MATIKSALELALERTKNLTIDEASVRASEARTEGKKAAGKFLEDSESIKLAAAIAARSAESREAFRKGLFDVLVAQIQLPSGESAPGKMDLVGKGLGAVAEAASQPAGAKAAAVKHVAELVRQVEMFMTRYIDDMKQVDQAIRTQWAPKLREKERQASARMGREVRLDPMADPEFAAFYKQNVDTARSGYIQALEGARTDLATLCGFAQE
ncbi:MAG: DUF6657 family protein [Rectinema sp.]